MAAVLLTVPVVVVSLFTLAALLEAIWAVAACAVARFVGGGGGAGGVGGGRRAAGLRCGRRLLVDLLYII